MYDETVKALRVCEEGQHCDLCPKWDDKQNGGMNVCQTALLKEAADAIEELSHRETPMRVRVTTSTKRCPSCNKQVSGIGNIHGNYRYCRWCGQAIDWSEPPKEDEIS